LKKILFIKILFLFFLPLYGNENSVQWEKILHYYHNENQIISNEFFLSSSINPTPKEELTTTKNLLLGKNGYEIACSFPARYEYLKTNFSEIPNFDLTQCKDLNTYINSFPKDKLSIVFTSEYTNNPSSAFGHIMLLFSKDNTPLEIGDVVHFAAKTSTDDNFFKYSYKGFTGKYNGYFLREPFFKKIYEYNTLEQRYMYIYTLNLSKEEIKTILYHLFELRKATFKYYFLDGNCASQTTDLLNIIMPNNDKKQNSYYLPIQTVQDFETRIEKKDRFIPLINKLNLLVQKMSTDEKYLFNEIIETKKEINNNTPDIVKEAATIHTTFNFRTFHKVDKNYENIMTQTFTKENINDNSPEPLLKTKPSNLGIGYYANKNESYALFQYRPLFLDLYDIQYNDLQESQTNTLTFDLLINEEKLKLNKFDILNIKSLPLQTNYYNPISWTVYTGFNRENIKENLVFNNQIGIGRTLGINYATRVSFLLNAGSDNLNYYLKPDLLFNFFTSSNSKVGILSSYKQYNGEYFYQNNLYLSYKYKDYLLTSEYIYDNSENKNKYLISLKYNF
jgi:hypothetical protein